MPRERDNLSATDAAQFRAWLKRVKANWEQRGWPWIATLTETDPHRKTPRRKRSDGSKEPKLPPRDRDWFMRLQNQKLPLGRKKALELCLRLWRFGIAAPDGIVRMLIDVTDDPLVILPAGEAKRLTDRIISGLQARGVLVNESGRIFLEEYFGRFESLIRNFRSLREAVDRFRSIHRAVGWWKIYEASNISEDESRFQTPSLFARLERETRHVEFDVRGRSK
jgi:hypothetical protein